MDGFAPAWVNEWPLCVAAELHERRIAANSPLVAGAQAELDGGELALGEPIGPKGLVTGRSRRRLQFLVIGLPKPALSGLLLIRAGELVCWLWFQDRRRLQRQARQ